MSNESNETTDVSTLKHSAGADIAEMAQQSFVDVSLGGLFVEWQQMRTIRKPIIGWLGLFIAVF